MGGLQNALKPVQRRPLAGSYLASDSICQALPQAPALWPHRHQLHACTMCERCQLQSSMRPDEICAVRRNRL